jgi:hypothetical protein
MAQKVNPISLRLQQTNRHFDSCWYSEYFYSELITKDLQLQSYFNSILKQLDYPRARFFIQNFQNKLQIQLFLCTSKAFRKERFSFFKLPKIKLKKRLKTKNLTFPFGPSLKQKQGTKGEATIYDGRRSQLKAKKANINLSGFYSDKKKTQNKYSFKESSIQTNFLNSYSLKNKKQSIFIFYLFLCFYCLPSTIIKNNLGIRTSEHKETRQDKRIRENINIREYSPMKGHLPDNHQRWIPSLMLGQRQKETEGKNHNLKKNFFLNYDVSFCTKTFKTEFKSFLIRYIILNYFIFSQSKLIANNYKLLYKTILLQLFTKKHILFLVSTYLKYKLYIYKIKSASNQKNTLSFHEYVFKVLYHQKQHQEETIKQKQGEMVTIYDGYEGRGLKIYDGIKKKSNVPNINNQNFISRNSIFKEHLESLISNHFHVTVNTFFYLISNESQCALFLADEVAYYLEKRVSFRTIKSKIMKEIQQKKHTFLKGIRITCSGRVGGKSKKAQRSKTQTFKYGQTGLHVFSSKIDFAFKNANTSFGQIGVKIWVCYDLHESSHH